MTINETDDPQIRSRGFGLRREILPVLAENYKSRLIEEIKAGGYRWTKGRMTFRLAREFGFCYGVDKAIDFAYETRAKFPDRSIYITSEIIHNPFVNRKLIEMGIEFLSGPYKGSKGKEEIGEGDIVLLPAFGTTVEELAYLKAKKCLLVDSTCNSVVAVWRRVEKYAEDGFTAVIHGKYDHEETRATCSRAGKFIVVWDKMEARMLGDFMLTGEGREDLLRHFTRAVSCGFDPDRDLERVGCANQTTMMSRESLEIASLLEAVMIEKYGAGKLANHFRHFDTICDATQERQDAIVELLDAERLDLVMVIGGYNSSNTTHLAEIAMQRGVPYYHVKDATSIHSKDKIEHKPLHAHEPVVGTGWLPEGRLVIGVTGGASTPNRVIEDVILKICSFAEPS